MADSPTLPTYPGHAALLPEIVRAENCDLFDARGRRYVDLEAGVWCTSVGHGHPRVLEALRAQAAQISHTGFNYAHRIVEEAARALLGLLGFEGGRCVFLCSGSEAVEYGVRAARAVAPAPLLLTLSDSYFGAYGDASRRPAEAWHVHDWLAGADPEGIPFERVGAFLFEPGSSSGLVRFPPRELIRRVAESVRARDGLVLVNEVTTGMGRTGEWFGFQHYGLAPDVVSLGKGLGNGYPVSAVLLSPRALERMKGPVRYAQSHQNDPLGAAVALAVVRAVGEEALVPRARELGEVLLSGLEAISARTGRIRAVRARGLMAALELAGEARNALRVQAELVARGFVVGCRPGQSALRLDPALTVPRHDLEAFLAALEDVLRS